MPVTAWKPVLMLATEQREWQVSHCRKYNLVSFCRMVSGERHVWQVTYSSAGEHRGINTAAAANTPTSSHRLLIRTYKSPLVNEEEVLCGTLCANAVLKLITSTDFPHWCSLSCSAEAALPGVSSSVLTQHESSSFVTESSDQLWHTNTASVNSWVKQTAKLTITVVFHSPHQNQDRKLR